MDHDANAGFDTFLHLEPFTPRVIQTPLLSSGRTVSYPASVGVRPECTVDLDFKEYVAHCRKIFDTCVPVITDKVAHHSHQPGGPTTDEELDAVLRVMLLSLSLLLHHVCRVMPVHIPVSVHHSGNTGFHMRLWAGPKMTDVIKIVGEMRGNSFQYRLPTKEWVAECQRMARTSTKKNEFTTAIERLSASPADLVRLVNPIIDRNVFGNHAHLVRFPMSLHEKSHCVGLPVPCATSIELLREAFDPDSVNKRFRAHPSEHERISSACDDYVAIMNKTGLLS